MSNVILVVDDDIENRKLLDAVLTSRGYKVIQAEDGEQALDSARQNRPALIFMDFRLPWINGVNVTKMLKADEATAKIPIIMITATVMPGDREKILKESGAEEFIGKPVNIKEVAAVAKKYAGPAKPA